MVLDEADKALVVAAMPHSAQRVVAAIGFDLAVQFYAHLRGRRIHIPRAPRPMHPAVAAAVGLEAAERLRTVLGPGRCEIATCAGVTRPVRNRQIRAEFLAGEHIEDLSTKYRISARYVRTLIADLNPDPRAFAHRARIAAHLHAETLQ